MKLTSIKMRLSSRRNGTVADGGEAGVSITPPDMSGTGAKLTFTKAAINQYGDLEHMPETFTLVLRADRMQVESEIKWRRECQIGVRFLGPPKPMASRR